MISLTLLAAALMGQGDLSMRPRFEPAAPLPSLPSVTIDAFLDGIGLARRLLETRPALGRRTVFMTGDILDHGSFHDIEAMGLAHVKKPFDIRELARVVNEVVRDGPLREDLAT